MSVVSKIQLPDNSEVDIKDAISPRVYLGTCPTAAATVTKIVTVDEFPLDEDGKPLVGTLIGVKFTYTNSSSSPILNVNGTGAASIYYNNAVYTASSTIGGSAGRYIFYAWDGNYWVFMSWGVDNNDNTLAYNVRYNSASRTMSGATYRYRILFSSADDQHWVAATTSSSTNATASRTVNQTPINPFGQIVYYGSTTTVSSGSTPGATVLYTQYALTLGYSFNRTGAALTLTSKAPVYIKCAPQSNGSAIMDADTPYVQTLPTTDDGKIYIYLGIAYSATAVEMSIAHPVYYFKDSSIHLWTNTAASVTIDSALSSTSENPVQNKVINTALGARALDSGVVHNTGNETIAGNKTFTGSTTLDYVDIGGNVDLIGGTLYNEEETGFGWIQDSESGSLQDVLNGKEVSSNKITSLSSSSTDTQYPSAKCVWDIIGDVETLINAL